MAKKKEQSQQAPRKADELVKARTPQHVTSVRAKATGHKKKTADKWNQ